MQQLLSGILKQKMKKGQIDDNDLFLKSIKKRNKHPPVAAANAEISHEETEKNGPSVSVKVN